MMFVAVRSNETEANPATTEIVRITNTKSRFLIQESDEEQGVGYFQYLGLITNSNIFSVQ